MLVRLVVLPCLYLPRIQSIQLSCLDAEHQTRCGFESYQKQLSVFSLVCFG